MDSVLPFAIVFLLLNLGGGLIRVAKGPSAADRMLATLLFGSTSTALLLLLAEWLGQPAVYDVALLFVLLAAVLSVAFVALFPKKVTK